MKKNIHLLLLCALFSISCTVSPRPVIRLNNLNSDLVKLWIQGKENIEVPDGKFKYIVSFDDMKDGQICFNVSVSNNSNKPRIIDHYLFRINYSNNDNDNPQTSCVAINPETKLINIDKNISRERARHSSEIATDALFSLFDIVETFTDDWQKTEEEIQQEEIDDLEDELDQVKEEQKHLTRMYELNKARNYHELTTLRRTTLLPGHTISGKIYFPYTVGYRYVRLNIDSGQNRINYEIKEIPALMY